MKKIKYIIGLIAIFSFTVNAQKDNKLYRISSATEPTPFTTGYRNIQGDTVIPVGKYVSCISPIFDRIAIVSVKGRPGFFAIDRKEKVLFEIFILDNEPDPIQEGLFRILEGNKIGYANMNGEIVINPRFDSASPFKDGFAAICIGCTVEKEYEITKKVGGKWGLINKNGLFVIKPEYESISKWRNKKATVKKNGIWSEVEF